MYLHEIAGSFILLQLLDYFTSAVFFFLAVCILLRNPRSSLNRAAFWLLGSFFVWSLSLLIVHNPYSTKETAALFYNIGSVGWASFGGLSLYFAIILSGDKNLGRFKNLALIPLPLFIYLQWAGYLAQDYVKQPWGWSYRWAPSLWPLAYYLYFTVFVAAALYILYTLRQKAESKLIRGQASIILFTGGISLVLALITDVILPQLNIYSVPNIAPSCILIFAFGVIYAIGRYQFVLSEEEIIARAGQQWENTFNAISDGVYLHDMNQDIINVNSALCKMLNRTKTDLVGDKCFRIFSFSNKPSADRRLEAMKSSKKDQYEEVFDPRLNLWLGFSTSPLFNEDHDLVGIIHVIRDITERKKAEEALKARALELEKLNQVMVGRELKMIELKEELAKLKEKK